jgi:catechol 2,3-dioxygenase-like lactoylglutathione lyase family enzyme
MGLEALPVGPVVPVSDLDTSLAYYERLLGLAGEPAPGGYRLRAGDRTVIYLLTGTDYAGQAEWPLMSFKTDDLAGTVDELLARGVRTERDVPYDVDDRGIATTDGMRIAWLRDPDRQVIALFELA